MCARLLYVENEPLSMVNSCRARRVLIPHHHDDKEPRLPDVRGRTDDQPSAARTVRSTSQTACHHHVVLVTSKKSGSANRHAPYSGLAVAKKSKISVNRPVAASTVSTTHEMIPTPPATANRRR